LGTVAQIEATQDEHTLHGRGRGLNAIPRVIAESEARIVRELAKT
jgi:hypothetical protein